jgi:hypothetical protein
MKGKEPLLPESEEWRGKLRTMLAHAVAGAGWTMAQDFSAPEATADDQLRAVVLRIRQRYETVAAQLKKKPGNVEQGRYTLGDEVALLPCSADSDSLLFVHAEGLVKTGGRKLFAVLVGGSAGILLSEPTYRISIAFADAKTGRITAFTTVRLLGGKVGEHPETVLDDRLAEEFRKMRPAAPKP